MTTENRTFVRGPLLTSRLSPNDVMLIWALRARDEDFDTIAAHMDISVTSVRQVLDRDAWTLRQEQAWGDIPLPDLEFNQLPAAAQKRFNKLALADDDREESSIFDDDEPKQLELGSLLRSVDLEDESYLGEAPEAAPDEPEAASEATTGQLLTVAEGRMLNDLQSTLDKLTEEHDATGIQLRIANQIVRLLVKSTS